MQSEFAEGVEVLSHHLQLEGACAAYVIAGNYFGQFFDGFFELRSCIGIVAVSIQAHKSEYAQANFVPIDLSPVTSDEACLFKRAHTAPAGRC